MNYWIEISKHRRFRVELFIVKKFRNGKVETSYHLNAILSDVSSCRVEANTEDLAWEALHYKLELKAYLGDTTIQ